MKGPRRANLPVDRPDTRRIGFRSTGLATDNEQDEVRAARPRSEARTPSGAGREALALINKRERRQYRWRGVSAGSEHAFQVREGVFAGGRHSLEQAK